MANFNEHALEMSIMELLKDEGYIYVSGDQIHRERTEVLLTDDLKQYLYNRYCPSKKSNSGSDTSPFSNSLICGYIQTEPYM